MGRESLLASVSKALIFVISKYMSSLFTKSDTTLTECWLPPSFLPSAAMMTLWSSSEGYFVLVLVAVNLRKS